MSSRNMKVEAQEYASFLSVKGGEVDAEMEVQAKKVGMSKQDYAAQVAGGKIIHHMMDTDYNECGMSASIYDAAFVIPQITRSAGNPRSLVTMTIRSYMFLFGNFFLQLFILYMIAQEELVMDKFAGEMNLCNFGAGIQTCPDGPNCIGPGGTNYQNAGRMYDYASWTTRTYVRDSLKILFPHKADEIQEKIDPGEYGLENYWVRIVCVFIFMMSLISDLRTSIDFLYILWYVPSEAQPWIEYRVPKWAPKEKVKEVLECSEVDFIKFKIAGMPKYWKIINFIVIVLPKLFIWKKTAKCGVMFLMETAGIEDVIVNVTALTFILNLDEMLFQNFSHKALHHILEHLEPWLIESTDEDEQFSVEKNFDTVVEQRNGAIFTFGLIPMRPVLTLLLSAFFIGEYYYCFCQMSDTGGLVSKAQALPKDQIYPLLAFAFPFYEPVYEETNYWSPP
mmetsp:Transcript_97118/g.313002  ORF Transcript_97118/g.313002 Transcript_97118/m.313002 type:complete len:450 (+) Transcript_97118:88-1437(+)